LKKTYRGQKKNGETLPTDVKAKEKTEGRKKWGDLEIERLQVQRKRKKRNSMRVKNRVADKKKGGGGVKKEAQRCAEI